MIKLVQNFACSGFNFSQRPKYDELLSNYACLGFNLSLRPSIQAANPEAMRVVVAEVDAVVDAGLISYDKVIQSVTSNSRSKKHGPITSSDLTVRTQIRVCDWSVLFAFAFARNTVTHSVIVRAISHVIQLALDPIS